MIWPALSSWERATKLEKAPAPLTMSPRETPGTEWRAQFNALQCGTILADFRASTSSPSRTFPTPSMGRGRPYADGGPIILALWLAEVLDGPDLYPIEGCFWQGKLGRKTSKGSITGGNSTRLYYLSVGQV